MTASRGSVVTAADGSFTWSLNPSDPAAAVPVTITATDSAGRTATTTFTLTIPEPTLNVPSCIVRNANGTLAPFSVTWTNLANSSVQRRSYWMNVERVPGRTPGDILSRLISFGQTYSHATTWAGDIGAQFGSIPLGFSPVYVNVRSPEHFDPVLVEKAVPICNDTTPPTEVATVTGPMGNFGWHTGNVGVSWLVSDPESAYTSTGCGTQSVTTDTAGVTFTCSATSLGGTSSASVTVKRDATGPVLAVPTQPVVVEGTDPSGAVATYAATASDATSGTGTPVCSPASGSVFAVGATSVTCQAQDVAGNTSYATFTVRVQDTVAPDFIVSDRTGEATGPAGAEMRFATPTTSDAVDGTGHAVCTRESGTTFALGETTVTCTATDAAGNTRSRSFTVTVFDTTKPSLDVSADRTAEATGPGGAEVEYDAATATDLVDGSPAATCDLASGHEFPLGTTTVTCSATDAAGNTVQETFDVTVEDTTKPDLRVPADWTVEADGPAGTDVTFTATATDLVDGDRDVTCDPRSGTTFALGTTTVSCSASDTRGNEATDTFEVGVRDTTAPDFAAPDAMTVEATGPSGAAVTYAGPTTTDAVDGDGVAGCTPASGSTFALGTTAVTCTATDKAGNTSSHAFDVIVVDTTKPTLTVPDAVVAEATSGDGAKVDFAAATATDLVDAAPAVACDRASGGQFALGQTKVSCTATDEAGNAADASFTVTVSDTRAPVLDLPSDRTVEATGPTGAQTAFAATASDAVEGSVPVTCDPASGATFALGATEVTCTASDSQRQETTGTFTVTVVDTTPPSITAPSGMTAEATGPGGAKVSWAATADDLVDGATPVTCSPPAGTTFRLGTTTVRCTATDAAGNTRTRGFPVAVRDTTDPVITLPADFAINATSSSGASVPITGSATDLVSGDRRLVCDPPNASAFEVPAVIRLPIGRHVLRCWATDAAGNRADHVLTIVVLSAAQQGSALKTTLTGFALTEGAAAPLMSKIDKVIAALDPATTPKQPIRTVITPLENQIKAMSGPQPGKTMTSAQGAQLLTLTKNIRTIVQPLTYSLGGTVTGLASKESVTLSNNAGDVVTVRGTGEVVTFAFPTEWVDDATYRVTVASVKSRLRMQCTVVNGTGTIDDADVTDIEVTCR